MASRVQGPITVAIIDDYDVVVMGLANMLDQYSDRVVIAELDTNEALLDTVDIALYDSFAQPESDHDEIAVLVANPRARRVVVYTWNFHPDLIHSALQQGAHGYLSKTLPARELVTALEAVHAGKTIISEGPPRAQCRRTRLARPRRRTQRSRVGDLGPRHARQAQCPGRSTDISEPEHRKVLHPPIYRKIEVGSRTQAVLWASTMDSPQTSTGSIIGEVVPEQAVIFSPFRVKTATPSSSTTMRPRLVD